MIKSLRPGQSITVNCSRGEWNLNMEISIVRFDGRYDAMGAFVVSISFVRSFGSFGSFGSFVLIHKKPGDSDAQTSSIQKRPCHNEDKPQTITLHHEVFNEATSCSGAIWLCYRSFYTASVGVSGKSPSNFTRLHIFCCSTTIITPVPLVSVPDTTTAVVLFLPVNCTCNRYPIARQRRRFHR